jgi:hypothetical protein
MDETAESLIQDAIACLCNPEADSANARPVSVRSAASNDAVFSEISQATPRAAGSDHAAKEAADSEIMERPSVWAEAGRKLLIQLALLCVMLLVFWWRGMLPHQKKAKAGEPGVERSVSDEF